MHAYVARDIAHTHQHPPPDVEGQKWPRITTLVDVISLALRERFEIREGKPSFRGAAVAAFGCTLPPPRPRPLGGQKGQG